MDQSTRRLIILLAEDDPDDRALVAEAVRESGVPGELRMVTDGEELLDYLRRRGRYESSRSHPRPDLVLLDLNMPRKDGREALAEIKGDRELRRIPIVVFTTSTASDDIRRAYDLGVASYIAKPTSFGGLVELMRAISRYWGELALLPDNSEEPEHGRPTR